MASLRLHELDVRGETRRLAEKSRWTDAKDAPDKTLVRGNGWPVPIRQMLAARTWRAPCRASDSANLFHIARSMQE